MKFLFTILKIVVAAYVVFCIALYFSQEKLIFLPDKLPVNAPFQFPGKFEEKFFPLSDGSTLHGVLFKSDSAKGLIFYLHGNAGSIASWGAIAPVYTQLHYDLFIVDYPGYGKSEGSVHQEEQVHTAIQQVYDKMKTQYAENSIIVLGYSIGTGFAARLAAHNHPRLLILQAPYYSLVDMMHNLYPIVPTMLLKYPLRTNEQLPACRMPVVIFHGDNDAVIDYRSSLKLKESFKPGDTLIILEGQGHNGITNNKEYQIALQKILQ